MSWHIHKMRNSKAVYVDVEEGLPAMYKCPRSDKVVHPADIQNRTQKVVNHWSMGENDCHQW